MIPERDDQEEEEERNLPCQEQKEEEGKREEFDGAVCADAGDFYPERTRVVELRVHRHV